MGSVTIEGMRREYPGKSDSEIAKQHALKYDIHVVVAYTSDFTDSDEWTNLGLCNNQDEVTQYMCLRNARVLYDDGCALSADEAVEQGLRAYQEFQMQRYRDKRWWQFWIRKPGK